MNRPLNPKSRRGKGLTDADFEYSRTSMALILIVEDEIFIRQSAEWIIEDLGHQTLLAHDLDGALLHILGGQPIDAMFVDLRLGPKGLAGYGLAEEAIKHRPELRVLYTSGTRLCAEMSAQFVAGAHFLEKPYSPDQLEAAISLLLKPFIPAPAPRQRSAPTFV
ncbi:hypothetical protein BH11PSE2_BH11PSE2_12000 [soil metagenome]